MIHGVAPQLLFPLFIIFYRSFPSCSSLTRLYSKAADPHLGPSSSSSSRLLLELGFIIVPKHTCPLLVWDTLEGENDFLLCFDSVEPPEMNQSSGTEGSCFCSGILPFDWVGKPDHMQRLCSQRLSHLTICSPLPPASCLSLSPP